MKAIEIKTRKGFYEPKSSTGNDEVTIYLRHSEDRIEVKNGEMVNIDVYSNGSLIFSGDNQEFYEQLKK